MQLKQKLIVTHPPIAEENNQLKKHKTTNKW